MRVFLDTNVLVSAFASRGICADLLEVILLGHDLIVGRNVLRELDKALRSRIRLPAIRSSEPVAFVVGEAMEVVEKAQPVDAKVDVDDALVPGEARSARAEMFVTGDAALLELGAVNGLLIMSPRQFRETLRAGRT